MEEQVYYRRLGARIRALREAAGLSQLELARALGWNPPTLNRYEQGERKISLPDLERLARALGRTVGDVLVPEELFEESVELRRELEALPRERLREILEYARRLRREEPPNSLPSARLAV